MQQDTKKILYALSILVGTIVGLGPFGLPYAFAHAGFGIGMVYLAGLALVVLTMHLVYGEIVLRTPTKQRLIGYAAMYLGKNGKIAATLVMIVGLYGILLAYTIVGGIFLEVLAAQFLTYSATTWSLVFFAMMAFFIVTDFKNGAPAEFFMTAALIAAFIFIIAKTLGDFSIANISVAQDTAQAFLPYGIVFFALTGSSAIPELRDVLTGDGRMKKVIIIGTLIPAVLYALFALGTVSALGMAVSKDAVVSLAARYGASMAITGGLVGLLTTATSFIVLGLVLKHAYMFDLGIPDRRAAAAVLAVPLILFFTATQDFLMVIGFVGAVLGGIEGLLMLAIHRKAQQSGQRSPEYALKLPPWVYGGIATMFLVGIVYEIVYAIQ